MPAWASSSATRSRRVSCAGLRRGGRPERAPDQEQARARRAGRRARPSAVVPVERREQPGQVVAGALEALGVRRPAVGADEPARRGWRTRRRSRRRRPRRGRGPRRSPAPRGGRRARWRSCTTRSMQPATVGTTNAWPTFSPASSGSVHILVTASRAELAWMVHMPGRPEFSAMSRSRLSSWRTSPTMMRDGRIRSASLTSRRSLISPVPFEAGLPALHRHHVGQRDLELEDLLAGHHPLPGRDRGGQAVQQRGLAGLGAAGHEHVEPAGDGRLEEAGRLPGERAELDEVVEVGRAHDELADVDRPVLAGDVGDRDVQPAAVGEHRVDERASRGPPGGPRTSASSRPGRGPRRRSGSWWSARGRRGGR